jgi:hypothetical protein
VDSPASIVDDVLYDTSDIAISLGEIEVTQTGRRFVVVRVRFELDNDFSLHLRSPEPTYDGV